MTQKLLEKIKTILGIAVIIVPILIATVLAFNTISRNTDVLLLHDKRIDVLEDGRQTNREILLEIQFNLKQHMITRGEEYIERDANR